MNQKIDILFETKDYAVIQKPAGILVHADTHHDEETIVDWVLEKYPKSRTVGDTTVQQDIKMNRSGIVHRLDRDTSGCLIITKNQLAYEYFKDLFKQRKIDKEYHAFVYGHVAIPDVSLAKSVKGLITAPVGRSREDIRMFQAQRGARGNLRKARTEYDIVKHFSVDDEPYTFIKFYPKTGRTHQVRVHAKYIHAPIVSDIIYSGKRQKKLDFHRHALHARKLHFFDMGGMEREIVAPYPQDFQKIFDQFLNGYDQD